MFQLWFESADRYNPMVRAAMFSVHISSPAPGNAQGWITGRVQGGEAL